MTQQGLIDRIIDVLYLQDDNTKDTPENVGTLPKGEESDCGNASFNYASVLGILSYLQGHSRPDITFAVNQCARYTFAPKYLHEEAMKIIGRYLKSTRTKYLIMNPKEILQIDCFVDSDFSGLWKYEDSQDPTSVKSRSGFLFIIGGCPISWTSKLQTDIDLLTMEAEYITLSMAMKELLPLQIIVKDICKHLNISSDLQAPT